MYYIGRVFLLRISFCKKKKTLTTAGSLQLFFAITRWMDEYLSLTCNTCDSEIENKMYLNRTS